MTLAFGLIYRNTHFFPLLTFLEASKLALGSGHSNKPSNQQPSDNSDSMQVDPQRPRTVPKPPPSDPLALTPKDIAERRKEREERAKLSAIMYYFCKLRQKIGKS